MQVYLEYLYPSIPGVPVSKKPLEYLAQLWSVCKPGVDLETNQRKVGEET